MSRERNSWSLFVVNVAAMYLVPERHLTFGATRGVLSGPLLVKDLGRETATHLLDTDHNN